MDFTRELYFRLRRAPGYGLMRWALDAMHERAHRDFRIHGMTHRAKARVIRACARRYGARVLVETGTHFGDMIWRLRDDFDRLVSIEIDPRFATEARLRFRSQDKVTVVQGDSASELRKIARDIPDRCLFWLDGHYSGGQTGGAGLDSPILSELRDIWATIRVEPVVLIDDARLFNGTDGYPTMATLRAEVTRARPQSKFEIQDDIVVIVP